MKIIRYKIYNLCNHGTEEEPKWVEIITESTMPYCEETLALAKEVSYNGEFIIEDDGKPDPAKQPTQLDAIEAQVTYTAMMTDTLLEV